MNEAPQSKIFPKKFFGQNFLINPATQNKIIQSCELHPDDIVLEIGPGKGALTEQICPSVKRVIAVEIDRQLVNLLEKKFNNSNAEIISQDILQFPFSSLTEKMKLIGNLPYNISTPILEKIFQNMDIFNSIYITVQLEYGKRLTAQPHSKEYGSLSCFAQYYCETKLLFKIKNTHFNPIPKVQSCFVRLIPRKKSLLSKPAEEVFLRLIKQAFGQRRKKAINALAEMVDKEATLKIFRQLNINENARAENLSLTNYLKMAEYILNHTSASP